MMLPLAAVAAVLVLLAPPVRAVELVLESVTALTDSGEVQLRLTDRARFDLDPVTATLVSSGTWLAEYVLPNQVTRFAHKVEDLRVTADGPLTMRSYECVEGTFGATFLAANSCGNYRFGPNGIDEGGAADDEAGGPARSLTGYRVAAFDWDGKSLLLDLVNPDPGSAGLFRENRLRLRLVAKGKTILRR